MLHHPREADFVCGVNEGVGHTVSVCPPRSPNPVHIVVGHPGDSEIDHHLGFRNIDASGAHIRTDEDTNLSGTELSHGGQSRVLCLVRVDLRHLAWKNLLDGLTNALGIFLGSNKQQRARVLVGRGEPVKHNVDFRLDVRGPQRKLIDGFHRSSFWCHLDSRRPQQELIRQSLHSGGERGAEQQVLSFARNHFQDVPKLWHEPHVHHAVSLIQNHGVDFFGDQCPPQVQLHEPSGGRNNDICPLSQRRHLGLGAHASDQNQRPDVRMRGKVKNCGMNLQGELLGGYENDDSRCSVLPSLEFLQKRNDIGSCFSGTRLSNANDVLTRQDFWDGLNLNGGGSGKPQIFHRIQELTLQLELFEPHCPKVRGNLSCSMIEREARVSEFTDMAPLHGREAEVALHRLRESRDWSRELSRLVPSEDAQSLAEAWSRTNDTESFQSMVVKPFLESLMRQTTDGVTWDAAPGALDQGMLFLSNHRDIVLDPSLVNVALLNHGRSSTEIGIGSNLLGSQWVSDLVRLNRCFVVERSGSARERYEHSQRTARYIRHVVREGIPVWLAHREGRAKDGMDATAPALIRTLSDGCQAEAWNGLKVVPVSISYEWDPCDAFKVNELLHTKEYGSYQKQAGEDELSMWTGLVGHKGRVHLQFGEVHPWMDSSGDARAERAMATHFDSHLMAGMKLWPNQGLAAEQLGLSSELIHMADPASDPDRKAFNKRLKGIATALQKQGWGEEAAMTQWCEILAAPLIRRQALLDEAGHGNGTRN